MRERIRSLILLQDCDNNIKAIITKKKEAPLRIQRIEDEIEESYDFELIKRSGEPVQLDLGIMIKQLIVDIREKKAIGIISTKFHNCLAKGLLEMAKSARESTQLNTVALSGGVFCNRYLTIRCIKLLKKAGFSVLFNREVPSNDGGISLGQAAIAAKLS